MSTPKKAAQGELLQIQPSDTDDLQLQLLVDLLLVKKNICSYSCVSRSVPSNFGMPFSV